MNNRIIKEALAYSLGSDLHEAWRTPRKKADGTYEPRIKKSTDKAWNESHGTNEVDIANCSFSQLPSNWQYENLEAARIVIELVYDKVIAKENFTTDEIEEIAAIIHEKWLERNSWVFDPNYGNLKLAVPYTNLSDEEKAKDRAQITPAILKVQAYMNGLIDIDTLITQYNIEINKQIKKELI